MNGLDLRLRPPRPPHARLDGLVFMPRTIDKIRATLPGGYSGPYTISPGLSQILLDLIDVRLESLRDAVCLASNDADVALWLRTHADFGAYERANVLLTQFRNSDVPSEQRARFELLYPEYLRAAHPRLFDLLRADDSDLYPALGNE